MTLLSSSSSSGLYFYFVVTLLLCLQLISFAYADTCHGILFVAPKDGVISSNPPTEDYKENSDCVWYLTAIPSPDSSLSIRIDRLDLEFNYDYVAIYRGVIEGIINTGGPGNPLTFLTGPLSTLPTQNLKFQGDKFTIWFHSDNYINGKGFSLTYGINSCNKPCINGLCLNGTCSCNTGYKGPTCEDGTCLSDNDCSGKGLCSNSSCVCTPGFYGPNCNDSYCVKKSVYTQKSGTFRSNQGFGYLNGQTCSWLISSSGYSTITLNFLRMDTEYEYDFIRVYDGSNAASPLLGVFSGNRLPSPVHSSTGTVFVTFDSDVSLTRKGFEIAWDSYNCPGNCSYQGQCFDGVCSCQTGFTGLLCDTEFCDNNCTLQGACNVSKCICNTGYHGADCSICELPASQCSYAGYESCDDEAVKIRKETSGDLYVYHGDDSNFCTWMIQPVLPNNDTSLVLTFTEFSMSGVNVTIYDGNGTDYYLVGQFTGDTPPAKLLITTGVAQIFISKTAGSTISSLRRFSLSWELVTCTGGCSDNGVCGFQGCECGVGFKGPNCNETFCANNCSTPQGTCQSDKCVCADGFYGVDCSDLYCSGLVVYDEKFNTIRDHSSQIAAYRRLSNCTFDIRPPMSNGSTITLLFKSFQTEVGRDFVMLSNDERFLGNFSGGYSPLPIISNSPVRVRFVSDFRNEFLGFQLDYSCSDLCPKGCSNNGYCNNGQCICFPGWSGMACDSQTTTYEKLQDGTVTYGYVDRYNWKVYTYYNRDDAFVSFQLKSQNGRDLFFYLNFDAPPSFNRSYTSVAFSGSTQKELRVYTRGKTWYLGVYGQDTDNFTISLGTPIIYDDNLSDGQKVSLVFATLLVVIAISFVAIVLIGLAILIVRQVMHNPQHNRPQEVEMNAVNTSSTVTTDSVAAPGHTDTPQVPTYMPPTTESTGPAPAAGAQPRRGDEEDESSEMSGIRTPNNSTGYARF